MYVQRLSREVARKANDGARAMTGAAHFESLAAWPAVECVCGGAPGATCELGIEPVSVHVFHASACTAAAISSHLSNLFVPCDAQFFSITLSAVCLEAAMDELVACGSGAIATPPSGPCACGLDRKPLGRVLWPLSMPSAWHSSACVRRASRRSPERLAGPRADLGRTWAT